MTVAVWEKAHRAKVTPCTKLATQSGFGTSTQDGTVTATFRLSEKISETTLTTILAQSVKRNGRILTTLDTIC